MSTERLKPAAIGFSSHSGWAAAVCLGGGPSLPVIIERSRVLLTLAPLPCEPYHDAKRGGARNAEEIVASAAKEARDLAVEAISGFATLLRVREYHLIASGVVLAGGKPGVTLAHALSTHAAMHGAEGWLFREALIEASQKCGLTTVGVPERELAARAAKSLGRPETGVSGLVQELGCGEGPPWGRDQKLASLAALVALRSASHGKPA